MPRTLLNSGTAEELQSYIGVKNEAVIDLTNKGIRVYDGIKSDGYLISPNMLEAVYNEIDSVKASITTTKEVQATTDRAIARFYEDLNVEFNSNIARVTKEIKTEAGKTYALATDFEQLSVSLETEIQDRIVSISETENVLKAYAEAQDALEKVRADAYADGVASAAEQAAIDAAQAYADLKKIEAQAYADGKVTTSEQNTINTARAYADLKKVEANAYSDGIVTAEETRAIADAQAKYDAAVAHINSVKTTLEASITNESTTRVNQDLALAQSINTLSTSVNTQLYDISQQAQQALQDAANAFAVADGKIMSFYQVSAPATGMREGDLWFDTDDNNKVYRYNGTSWVVTNDLRIAQAVQAAATAQATADGKIETFIQDNPPITGMSIGDLWFDSNDNYKMYRYSGSAWLLVADTRIATNEANITNEATARASADSALSQSIQTLTSRVGTNEGAITNETLARATADSVLTQSVNTLSSTVSGHTTTINQHTSSINGMSGKWGVHIDSNGHVTGIELIGTGSTSQFIINADVIINGSLTTGKIGANAVTATLSASGGASAQTASYYFSENTSVIIICTGTWSGVSGPETAYLYLYRDGINIKTWLVPRIYLGDYSLNTGATYVYIDTVSSGNHYYSIGLGGYGANTSGVIALITKR